MTLLPTESVQDYPRPPLLEPVAHRITIDFGGVRIAETNAAWRVCETHHAPTYYLPQTAFSQVDFLPAPGISFCEWKGQARYVSFRTGHTTAPRCAWVYDRPTARFAPIAGYYAVYPETMDMCSVAGCSVLPQPGSFYGGWVTSNLSGVIKGGPSTEGW